MTFYNNLGLQFTTHNTPPIDLHLLCPSGLQTLLKLANIDKPIYFLKRQTTYTLLSSGCETSLVSDFDAFATKYHHRIDLNWY